MISVINNDQQPLPSLGQLSPGEKAEIVGFQQPDEAAASFLHRLFEVGFLEGSHLEVLQEAPFSKDPISVRIKDATYALRRAEASLIQVRKL